MIDSCQKFLSCECEDQLLQCAHSNESLSSLKRIFVVVVVVVVDIAQRSFDRYFNVCFCSDVSTLGRERSNRSSSHTSYTDGQSNYTEITLPTFYFVYTFANHFWIKTKYDISQALCSFSDLVHSHTLSNTVKQLYEFYLTFLVVPRSFLPVLKANRKPGLEVRSHHGGIKIINRKLKNKKK